MYLSHIGFIEEEKKKLSPDFYRDTAQKNPHCAIKTGIFIVFASHSALPFQCDCAAVCGRVGEVGGVDGRV